MTSTISREDILRFWKNRGNSDDQAAARFHSEHTPYDLQSIFTKLLPGYHILDLGCGTCAIANSIIEMTDDTTVDAVDFVEKFLRFAKKTPRINTSASDILHFKAECKYNMVLLLGVINSFPSVSERGQLYANCRDMLLEGGTLFVKSQFGRYENVEVSKFSEELGQDYYAVYPYLQDEVELISKYLSIEQVLDPYPDAMNPHANTRFHHIFARKER